MGTMFARQGTPDLINLARSPVDFVEGKWRLGAGHRKRLNSFAAVAAAHGLMGELSVIALLRSFSVPRQSLLQ